jgi:L-serine dehydratase
LTAACDYRIVGRVNEQRVPLPSILRVLKPAIGPSSSHTLGAMEAGRRFRDRLLLQSDLQTGDSLVVTLLGSLAHTGKGHLTDRAVVAGLCGYGPLDLVHRTIESIYEEMSATGVLLLPSGGIVFRPETDIVFDTQTPATAHPNTLRIALLDRMGSVRLAGTYCSIGGGTVVEAQDLDGAEPRTQGASACAAELIRTCEQESRTLPALALSLESSIYGHASDDVYAHLRDVWRIMTSSVDRGLTTEGVLPGGLEVQRRAAAMQKRYTDRIRDRAVVSEPGARASIYAIAAAEENAAGGAVITAPTCGSAGVLPACLRVIQEERKVPDGRILDALLVAGIVGGLAIAKASIAGALVGCQGEIGVASAMAAAAVCSLLGGSVFDQIDRAAETALEHFLGLTCDPVAGLVQIPCIERNAAGAVSALNAASLAMLSGGRDCISFDETLEAMHQTGLDMRSRYKETSLGGLAAVHGLEQIERQL